MRFGERANPPVFRDEALREWIAQDIMHELKTDGGATFSLGRIANTSTLQRRGPAPGARPRDITARLGRGTPQGPMPQCTSATFPRVERAGRVNDMLGQTHRRRQSADGPGRISTKHASRR
jgi:hypothetical protein